MSDTLEQRLEKLEKLVARLTERLDRQDAEQLASYEAEFPQLRDMPPIAKQP